MHREAPVSGIAVSSHVFSSIVSVFIIVLFFDLPDQASIVYSGVTVDSRNTNNERKTLFIGNRIIPYTTLISEFCVLRYLLQVATANESWARQYGQRWL